MTFIAFGMIAKFYIYPWLKRLPYVETLTVLCFFQSFRSLGLSYLVPGVLNGPIPAAYAVQTSAGDLATAVLAILAIIFLKNNWRGAVSLVWLTTIVGILDLANSYYLGISLQGWNYSVGVMWFFAVLVTPIIIVAHFMTVKFLLKSSRES